MTLFDTIIRVLVVMGISLLVAWIAQTVWAVVMIAREIFPDGEEVTVNHSSHTQQKMT